MGFWDMFWAGFNLEYGWSDSANNVLYKDATQWPFLLGILMCILLACLFCWLSSLGLSRSVRNWQKESGFFTKLVKILTLTSLTLASGYIIFRGVSISRIYVHFATSKVGKKDRVTVLISGYKYWLVSHKPKRGKEYYEPKASFYAIVKHGVKTERIELSNKTYRIVSEFAHVKAGDELQVIENDKGDILFVKPINK